MARDTGFEDARTLVREKPAQERNRLWWEQLPMTYVEWTEDGRERRTLEGFDDATRQFRAGWIDDNVDFSAYAGRRVLEIGCGAGVATCLFAAAGAQVTAIDITEQAVAHTLRHLELRGLSEARVVRMDAERLDTERLDCPPAGFDHVFSWGVIHHSADPERIVANIATALKPGGTGLVMVYNRRSARYWLRGIIELARGLKFLKGETFRTVQRHYTDGYYHEHYTAAEMAAMLGRHGLAVTAVDVTHMAKRMIPFLPRGLDDILKRRWGWLLVVRFARP